jgi:hypothetical protein
VATRKLPERYSFYAFPVLCTSQPRINPKTQIRKSNQNKAQQPVLKAELFYQTEE